MVHEQQRHMQIRFEKTVHDPACCVALPRVHKNAADKFSAACHHERRGIAGIIDSSNVIRLQAQCKRGGRQ